MNARLTRGTWIGALFLTGVAAISSPAPAAVVGPIDFEESTDVSNNFRLTQGSLGTNTFSRLDAPDTGVLRFTSSSASGVGIATYDSTPGDTTPATHSTFLNETVTIDFRSASTSAGTAGIYLRVNDSTASGYLALVNFDPAAPSTADRLRLFKATTNVEGGTAGTAIVDAADTFSTNMAADTFYTLSFTATNLNATTVQLEAVVTSSTGNELASVSYQDNTSAYLDAGQVAVRMGAGASGNTIHVDNFTVVPEPAALSLAGLGLLCLRRRRMN